MGYPHDALDGRPAAYDHEQRKQKDGDGKCGRLMTANVVDSRGDHEKRKARGRKPDDKELGNEAIAGEDVWHEDSERERNFDNTNQLALHGRHRDGAVRSFLQRLNERRKREELERPGGKENSSENSLCNPDQAVHFPRPPVLSVGLRAISGANQEQQSIQDKTDDWRLSAHWFTARSVNFNHLAATNGGARVANRL